MPEHTGSALTTGPEIVIGSPQELTAAGGVGTTCASAIQATVEPAAAGALNVGGVMV